MSEIEIYCDGGCRGNHVKNNIGAWGVVLIYKGIIKEISGGAINTTNNKMELTAAIVGLSSIKNKDVPTKVYLDSAYVLNGITNWIYGWRKNGFKDSKKQPVKNRELWEDLYNLKCKFKNIDFIKVKGHSSNAGNNRADELCNIEMDKLIKE
ncbi:ribonuclease H family protein [Candidatus Epulonipiscium viviparus]|uniref:ribonuclease H family protein n=1 Tax=Candidatus Epulonipiscium viviparus TaxID=420336 RepID=UPI000495CF0F|nr:ribonuclease H [Candidatus Epulopiscium viviparus]